MAKLTTGPSHTLNIDPVLASWIGLNEAIFIQQLDFVLLKKADDNRYLKTIDGQRWYREPPREWVLHHFPFWDENVVKRALANLRKDGLVLARSDLNEYGTKDRSLWYSINYNALERLSGPVDRLLEKQEKRRKARQVRTKNEAKEGRDSDSEYTKVQNVLLTSEVQNVSDVKSTKCTPTKVQNVPLTQVQNVLTPKEVIPKEVIKDKPDKPARKMPQTIPSFQVYVEETGYYSLNKPQRRIIDKEVGDDPASLDRWREVVRTWILCGYKPINAKGMLDWFKNGIPDNVKGQENGRKQQRSNQPTHPAGAAGAQLADNTAELEREIARLEQLERLSVGSQASPASG